MVKQRENPSGKIFADKTESVSVKKLQANIDSELHHRFKTCCFLQGKDMREVLTELIETWLMVNGR